MMTKREMERWVKRKEDKRNGVVDRKERQREKKKGKKKLVKSPRV
jgi:hypothetical protein